MDIVIHLAGQENLKTLVTELSLEKIGQVVADLTGQFRKVASGIIHRFVNEGPLPTTTLKLETSLKAALQELGRGLLESTFNLLEPELEQMPDAIDFDDLVYRRINDKTPRRDIVTSFGKISLTRARYRHHASASRLIFPTELALGLDNGFTPAAASRIGQQFAACGSSQGRTLDMIEQQLNARIGVGKLRSLIETLADGLEVHRERAQVEQLMEWVENARETGEKPVLSISRDGVALGLSPWSSYEMASVGCISVLAGGTKLGTVYLARVPESNQTTMSALLTSLLTATIRACDDDVPDIVYVTDAGACETGYWRNTLRHLHVDGRRIKVTRVVDYFHASERLTLIADAIKFPGGSQERQKWLHRMQSLLLDEGGHGRVLRSIAAQRNQHGYSKHKADDAHEAERYIRRYRRFMNYAALQASDYPIGSGIIESACKQAVSQRMKLAGMRWRKQSGQHVMTLRAILMSGVWDKVFNAYLINKPTVSDYIAVKHAA